jgi:phospholipid transport system transporter-binding protein
MIEHEGNRLRVLVPMLTANAAGLLAAGRAALTGGGDQVVDLAAVSQADSSALAVMLGWLRTALQQGSSLQFANVPASLHSLSELYGVDELFPLA